MIRKPGPKLPSKRVWRKFKELYHPDWPKTPEADYTLPVRRIHQKRQKPPSP